MLTRLFAPRHPLSHSQQVAGAGVTALRGCSIRSAARCSNRLVVTRASQQGQRPQTAMGRQARRRLRQRAWHMQEREQLLQQADEQHLETLAATAETAALAKQLFVSSLRFEATAASVKDFFSRFGTVASVRIMPAGMNSISRTASSGRATVEFTDAASTRKVLRESDAHGQLSAMGIGHKSLVRLSPAKRAFGMQAGQRATGELAFDVLQLDIGSMFDKGTLIVEESIQQTAQLAMSLQDRCMRITVPIAGVQHQLLAHVRHVRQRLQVTTDGCMVFTLKQPPVVLKAKEDPMGLGSCNMGLSGMSRRPMPSAADFLTWPPLGSGEVEWVLAGDPTAHGTVGSCLSYRVKLSAAGALPTRLLEQLQSFRLLPRGSNWLRHGFAGYLTAVEPISASAWQVEHGKLRLEEQLTKLPWDVAYQVKRLLTEGMTTRWHVALPSFMDQLQQAPPSHAVHALEELAAAKHVSTSPAEDLKELLEDLAAAEEAAGAEEELPAHLCQVSRVHITPTRVKVQPLERDLTNRIIRHYCSRTRGADGAGALEASCFMRVGFGDEDGDLMLKRADWPLDVFYDRMLELMEHGIKLCGRHFQFLAYSASQLKEAACWMVATGGTGLTPDTMRAWMGDFMTTIRVPAKCAARMGQCFSTTVQAGIVTTLEEVPDVERNRYCFSDGVGCISPQLLSAMLAGLPFVTAASAPISAIQVRIAGCKGVLSLKPDLPGERMQVRRSMKKFGSSHSQLEVVNLAQLIPCYLNRQVILLLEYNGVPQKVFLEKQRAMLDQLQLIQDDAAKAAKLLATYGGVQNSTRNCMAALLSAHAHLCGRRAPVGQLMSSCLHAMAVYHAHDLKTKARLFVEKGAQLMGVMDEFGLLEEGEVFAQVQVKAESAPVVITGRVVLAKHPVMHPGDVRCVETADHSQLRAAYINVLVFSQKGLRPLPNELSGSDLDGDLYSIMWDPELITTASNRQAMDYSAPRPREVGEVTVQHLLDHFVDHARNQNLGQIANAWLAHADKDTPGCDQCLELATLHSTSVDFPKTGVPAIMRRDLAPKQCPHWMDNKMKDFYHSTSVLGQLYDQLQGHPLMHQPHIRQAQRQQQPQGGAHPDGRASTPATDLLGGAAFAARVAPGYQAYVDAAHREMERFVDALLALANRYQSYNFGELLTGCIIAHTTHERHRHYDMREQLEHDRRAVFDGARRAFVVQLLEGTGLAPVQLVGLGQTDLQRGMKQGTSSSSNTSSALPGHAVQLPEQKAQAHAGVQTHSEDNGAATNAAAVLSAATALPVTVDVHAMPGADAASSSAISSQAAANPAAAAGAAAMTEGASWNDYSLQQLEAVLDRLMPLSPAAIAAGQLSSTSARCQKAAAYQFVAAGAAEAAGGAGNTWDAEGDDADGGDMAQYGSDLEQGAGPAAAAPAVADPVVMARSAFAWVVWKELAAMVMGANDAKGHPDVLYQHFEALRLEQ